MLNSLKKKLFQKTNNLQILKYDQAYRKKYISGDSLKNHNGKSFSTSDNDNDGWDRGNCVDHYGANWWGKCGNNNINGKYGGNGDIGNEFMWWQSFNDVSTMSLKSVTLMFRQAD